MGREAEGVVQFDGMEAATRLLLESDALILRKPFSTRIARGDLTGALVQGDAMHLHTPRGALRADLGAKEAAAWVKALAKPPPKLAEKLGLGAGIRALTPLTDAALQAACEGALRPDAPLGLAELSDLASLETVLAALPPGLTALWCATRKGKAATFPEAHLRATLRAAGWIDTKTTAVSAEFTATRFNRCPSGTE